MKRAALLLLAAACGQPAATPATAPVDATTTLTATDCNFAMRFPGPTTVAPTQPDPKVITRAWAYAVPGGRVEWGVSCTKLPEIVEGHNQRSLLDVGRDGLVRGFHATLKSEKPITLDGHGGTDFELHMDSFPDISGPVSGRIRMYIIGDTVYQEMLFHGDDAPITDAELARVFDSFALIKPVHTVDAALAEVAWASRPVTGTPYTVLAPTVLVDGAAKELTNAATFFGAVVALNVTTFKIPRRAAVYAVRWGRLPPAALKHKPDEIYAQAKAELVERSKITFEHEEAATMAGAPGLRAWGHAAGEIQYDDDPGKSPAGEKNVWLAELRVAIVKGQIFELVVVAPEAEFQLADAARFLGSLAAK